VHIRIVILLYFCAVMEGTISKSNICRRCTRSSKWTCLV